MADIVIIGAGPVGLWTALQFKKRRPGAHIVVYERHAVYMRSHVLRLDHWSLILYAATLKDSTERAFYRDVTGRGLAGTRARFAKSLYLRTNELEAALKAHAQALGIELRLLRIESAEHAQSLHPECRLFVAADGAHSPLRTELFGPDAVERTVLQSVLELKCDEQVDEAASRAQALDALELWSLNRTLSHTAMEHVGRAREGRAAVTLRMFLTEEEYARLPPMSFKSPLVLAPGCLPADLECDVSAYLAARAGKGARLVPGSARLTRLQLEMYASRRFATMRGEVAWCLVGDAAMGVPYFRALNGGLILGSRLSQIIGRRAPLEPDSLRSRIGFYDGVHRPLHVATEFTIARGKDWLLDGFHAVREWLASEDDLPPSCFTES